MTLAEIYAALRDGEGQDRDLDHEINAYTPVVAGAEGYVRAFTGIDHAAMWALQGIPDHEWTPPEAEQRDGVEGYAATGHIGDGEPVTEWHREKPRAICMLAFRLRMVAEA